MSGVYHRNRRRTKKIFYDYKWRDAGAFSEERQPTPSYLATPDY
jgi:hypothetical protein